MSLPDVYFGSPGKKPVDWREAKEDPTPDDDEELAKTPNDVIEMLGFDPLELKSTQDAGHRLPSSMGLVPRRD